jgi:hypothetical protein
MQNTITGQQNMITMLNRVQAADARQIRTLNGEVSTLGTQLSDYRNEFPNTCTQAILTNGQAGSFNVPCSPKQS